MPAWWNQPAKFAIYGTEDVDRLNKLPFYLVKNEVKYFPIWNVFEQLTEDINWEPNEGNVMKGVTPQGSPVQSPLFVPNPITTLPLKDVFQVTEYVQQAIVYKHRYESFQFNFVPSFNSFWKDYLRFADRDIVEKIAIRQNQFLETQMWFVAPYVWSCGVGLVSGCPTGIGNTAYTGANSKTANWLIGLVTNPTTAPVQQMTLRDVYDSDIALVEDLAAPPFENARNMPIDNEGLKGKYPVITSSETWKTWTFDPDVNNLKPLDLNLLFEDFRGLLFGTTTVKIHRYPLRFNSVNVVDGAGNVLYAAGTFIDPEIWDATDNQRKPNPYYTSLTSAPFEIGWRLGASFGKSIKVGPPPKEFSTRNMSAEKFYAMRWNGEIQLTDQVLIQYPDGTIDLNNYGEQLKFISQATHGFLPGITRFMFPMIYRRKRPNIVSA